MKIGVFAYPTMRLDPGGGMFTLNQTFAYLERNGYDVHRFDPWIHRLEDFDLIHHFGLGYGNYDWFLTVKAAGKKLAVTTMYWLPDRPKSQRLSRKYLSRLTTLKPPPALVRLMLQEADLILPNAQGEKQLLSELYDVPEEKMALVPCGVADRFVGSDPEPFKAHFGIDNFLLCIGRFDPRQKNQLGLIRATRRTDLPLVFVGRPITGAEDYLAQCKKEAPAATLFIDYLNPEDNLLASAFAAANTLVVPSFYEYPCMVAMEALLAGTKVAITKGGTTQETFDQFASYFNPLSESDMRDTIVRTYHSDLPEGAVDYARSTFLWDNVGQKLESAYRKAGFLSSQVAI
ncbi:MAG: glycosyltransferase [bacterium]|nr:glycosyltransferase [bacterium]